MHLHLIWPADSWKDEEKSDRSTQYQLHLVDSLSLVVVAIERAESIILAVLALFLLYPSEVSYAQRA